jgi:hypothetical protein
VDEAEQQEALSASAAEIVAELKEARTSRSLRASGHTLHRRTDCSIDEIASRIIDHVGRLATLEHKAVLWARDRGEFGRLRSHYRHRSPGNDLILHDNSRLGRTSCATLY